MCNFKQFCQKETNVAPLVSRLTVERNMSTYYVFTHNLTANAEVVVIWSFTPNKVKVFIR